MSKGVLLYPYAVSKALSLRLSDFSDSSSGLAIQVAEVAGGQSDGSSAPNSSYDAFSSAQDWQKITFRLSASLDRTELERILPSTSSPLNDASLIVLVTCSATKLRHGVRLHATANGTWSGDASIQRNDVRGSVSFKAQLVRATGIPVDDLSPFATKVGSIIAIANELTLFVDHVPSSSVYSSVAISWEDFSNSEHPWRREHHNDVFHLDPYIAEPRLFLNSRHPQLRGMIESSAKKGPDAALRELIAVMIAQPVLLQLAMVSLLGIETDEDSQSVQAPTGWRGDMLENLLPRLYPELAADDERVERATRELREEDGAASLISRLGSCIQEILSSYKTIELAARAYDSTRGREEVDNA